MRKETEDRIVELFEGHIDPIDGYPTLTAGAISERLGLSRVCVRKVLSRRSKIYRRVSASGFTDNNSSYVYHARAWSKRDRCYLERKLCISLGEQRSKKTYKILTKEEWDYIEGRQK